MPFRIAAAAIVALAVLVPGTASPRALDDAPPYGGTKNAPGLNGGTPPPICQSRATDPALTYDRPFAGGPSPNGDVCGTVHNDSLKVTDTAGAGTHVSAGAGRDVIKAQNRRIDEIWGGPGANSATIDWCLPDGKVHDTTHDVAAAKIVKVKVNCVGVTQTHRYRSATITYPIVEPDVLCTVGTSGKRLITIPSEPEMNAVDATANVDWQTVAFSAVLYSWNGTAWVFAEQSPWAWDRAPDQQLEDFAGNFWRRFGETSHESVIFHPATSGRYRVAIRYHWYAENGVAEHDELDWANYHFGHFGSASQGYCDFPSAPPPDGHYAGTTDEGKAVSFDSAPIWSSVPRDVAGSRLTNVVIANTITCSPTRTLSFSVDVSPGRWIQLNADNTFAYARSGGLTSATRQNETATYSITGKLETSGTALGSLDISQASFDENGTHYTCTGAPHGWTAAKSG